LGAPAEKLWLEVPSAVSAFMGQEPPQPASHTGAAKGAACK